jgi:flagellar motor protein MotB
MMPNFNEYNESDSSRFDHNKLDQGKLDHEAEERTQLTSDEIEKRDRFELLSAYLDGEVTADEKRQVEVLLATDPAMQRLHTRLMKLRYSFRSLPVPPSEQPVEQTVAQVFAKIERKPRRMAWGGGLAIAALFVGALVGIVPRTEFAPSMARIQPENAVPSNGLMIALDRPVIAIPKATVATPSSLPQ